MTDTKPVSGFPTFQLVGQGLSLALVLFVVHAHMSVHLLYINFLVVYPLLPENADILYYVNNCKRRHHG